MLTRVVLPTGKGGEDLQERVGKQLRVCPGNLRTPPVRLQNRSPCPSHDNRTAPREKMSAWRARSNPPESDSPTLQKKNPGDLKDPRFTPAREHDETDKSRTLAKELRAHTRAQSAGRSFSLPCLPSVKEGQPATLARSCGFNLLVLPRPGQIFLSYTGGTKTRRYRGEGRGGQAPAPRENQSGFVEKARRPHFFSAQEKKGAAAGGDRPEPPRESATKGRNSNRRKRQRGTRTLAEKGAPGSAWSCDSTTRKATARVPRRCHRARVS